MFSISVVLIKQGDLPNKNVSRKNPQKWLQRNQTREIWKTNADFSR